MISVIIPYYHEEVWKECVESVRKITLPYELIVSDARGNGYDPSFDKYILHEELRKTGYSKSVNRAIEISAGDKILLLNADAVMTSGCVEELDRILALDSKIGIAGASAISNGKLVGAVEVDIFHNIYKQIKDYDDMVEVHLLNTECVLIKREVIDSIGILDDKNFWHDGSDLEYSLRAIKHGWKLILSKRAIVYHDRGKYKKEREAEDKPDLLGLLINPNNFVQVEEI